MEGSVAKVAKRSRVVAGAFSIVAGALILFDSFVFAYFAYPQFEYLISYIQKTGIVSFLVSMNSAYLAPFVNLILLASFFISGIFMFFRLGRTYLASGSIGIAMLVVLSFEYINSSTTYLALVAGITFVAVVAIAYSRMGVVIEQEEEELPLPNEAPTWPRIETF